MAKKRVALEIGMGTSLRKQDYTQAGIRALSDALWHNSLSMAEAFGLPKSAMIVDVEIGVQKPEHVDIEKVAAVLPYGQGAVRAVKGGLDIEKPDGTGVTVIANAAVVVSFAMTASDKGATS